MRVGVGVDVLTVPKAEEGATQNNGLRNIFIRKLISGVSFPNQHEAKILPVTIVV